MSRTTLGADLAGAVIELSLTDSALESYARAHLASLVRPPSGRAAVQANLRWHEGQPPARRDDRVRSMDRVDRDLYVGEDSLCWYRVDDLRDLFIDLTWRDGVLSIDGDFYFRLGNSDWSDRLRHLRQRRQLPHLRRRRYPTLLSYLVYYPCWWWLEQVADFHPIHAAGVATPSGVVLLAGASGVGKSTLSTALAATGENKALSDSFVLHQGTTIRPVREPILLDAWSRAWLGERAGVLQPLEEQYMLGRGGFRFPAERLSEGGETALLLFPRRAPRVYVRAIDSTLAHQRLSSADLIINDLRRYFAFAAVVEHLVPRGLVARREAHLEKLTARVPAYEVGLTADMTCEAAVSTVMELMEHHARREPRL